MNSPSSTPHQATRPYQRWDIFCQVIDHYGDAGISWRLARQLAQEFNITVRLWIDRLETLAAFCPQLNTTVSQQTIAIDSSASIEVHEWHANQIAMPIADVVICAFGCRLPDAYLQAIENNQLQPYWYNLEYLCTEKWVGHYHGLDSPHSRFALSQRFFFPGFSQHSGGLIREKGLIQKRQAWQADVGLQQTFKKALGLPKGKDNERYISVFCYPTIALTSLFSAWINGKTPVTALMPADQALISVQNLFDKPLTTGCLLKKGALTLKILPFTDQEHFDYLLWFSDLNIIRGEDSFVRALWSAKPFIWHIYPQAQQIHLNKLKAFAEHYAGGLHETTASVWETFQYAFNNHQPMAQQWPDCLSQLPALTQHAKAWVNSQQEHDMATQLVNDVIQRSTIK